MFVIAQTDDNAVSSKDLWTLSVDVDLGDNWRQKEIVVPGNGTPTVVDFFRAFAKAYPCEYHKLLLMAIDGDKEVLFNHSRPVIEIDKDQCLLENGNFAMRVFYDDGKPVALGVCCLKAITTKLQEAYYYRYNAATRKLTPLAQGSDFTGGIVKRSTAFYSGKDNNDVVMRHSWGRCGLKSKLVWNKDRFIVIDPAKESFHLNGGYYGIRSLLSDIVYRNEMELRDPEPPLEPGTEGGYGSLPIGIVIVDNESGSNYIDAFSYDGFYYFYARAWNRADGKKLVAVYIECAPEFDYDIKRSKNDSLCKTHHNLEAGDEVNLHFYLCDDAGKVSYLNPSSSTFTSIVGKGLPQLEHNEWRCVLGPDNEDLVFVRELDGQRKVFRWKDDLLKQ